MTITYGPNLGLAVNGNAGEGHYADLMKQWRGLDGLVMPNVKGYLVNTPPVSPADGDCYIIGAAPTGAWAGQGGKVTRYSTVAAVWEFFTPKNGWMLEANSARESYRYTGSAWEIFYQEGTWAPVCTAGSGSITSQSNTGTYVRVGSVVSASCEIYITNNGTGAASVTCSGLPFTAQFSSGTAGRERAISGKICSVSLISGATSFGIFTYDNLYPFSTGAIIAFTLTYKI